MDTFFISKRITELRLYKNVSSRKLSLDLNCSICCKVDCSGFFGSSMPLAECREQGKKAFSALGITEKTSTNPRNEVVGFKGDYKVVLYCVSDEGGCDEPTEPYASGGTIIVAGGNYATVKGLVDGVKAKLKLQ